MTAVPRLKRESVLLSVIDIQERLVTVMEHRARLIEESQRLIKAAEIFSIPVIVTEQYTRGLGATVPEIKEVLSEYALIEKMTFSCCGESGYLDAVKESGRKQILICGIEAHVCVLQTALDLLDEGYEVFIAENAVCSQKMHDHEAAVRRMIQAGVVPTSVESAIFELTGIAGTEEFKTMRKVII